MCSSSTNIYVLNLDLIHRLKGFGLTVNFKIHTFITRFAITGRRDKVYQNFLYLQNLRMIYLVQIIFLTDNTCKNGNYEIVCMPIDSGI